jgi:hypothetical protein
MGSFFLRLQKDFWANRPIQHGVHALCHDAGEGIVRHHNVQASSDLVLLRDRRVDSFIILVVLSPAQRHKVCNLAEVVLWKGVLGKGEQW